jgi:hypothetical protein
MFFEAVELPQYYSKEDELFKESQSEEASDTEVQAKTAEDIRTRFLSRLAYNKIWKRKD